jgi:aspartyl-tRNA(Asn)/glutamyl-tRNA(Gln) amidotransferase subunit C
MEVTDNTIAHLEKLARLSLSDQEKSKLKGQLGEMIDMFGKIASCNTDGVEPLMHMTHQYQQTRTDQEIQHLESKTALSLAKDATDKYFSVPKVIE